MINHNKIKNNIKITNKNITSNSTIEMGQSFFLYGNQVWIFVSHLRGNKKKKNSSRFKIRVPEPSAVSPVYKIILSSIKPLKQYLQLHGMPWWFLGAFCFKSSDQCCWFLDLELWTDLYLSNYGEACLVGQA